MSLALGDVCCCWEKAWQPGFLFMLVWNFVPNSDSFMLVWKLVPNSEFIFNFMFERSWLQDIRTTPPKKKQCFKILECGPCHPARCFDEAISHLLLLRPFFIKIAIWMLPLCSLAAMMTSNQTCCVSFARNGTVEEVEKCFLKGVL